MNDATFPIAIGLILGACARPAPASRVPTTSPEATATVSQRPEAPARPPLVLRPELESAAAVVHEMGVVTSAFVFASGSKSESFAAAQALWSMATSDELLQLLEHPSPIVRAYVAGHLAEEHPDSYPHLQTTLHDGGRFNAVYGCTGIEDSVAASVVRALCWVYESDGEHSRAAKRLIDLATASRDPEGRKVATQCLTDYRLMREPP